jgi:hypothetical protein
MFGPSLALSATVMRLDHFALLGLLGLLSTGCSLVARVPPAPTKGERFEIMSRARVWSPTDIHAMDLRSGPQGPGAFPSGAAVTCDYVDARLHGNSPKFVCRITEGDEVKVKYGIENGEVYGELLATRLLWALGFGADRMYQVDVVCRGCPESLGGIARPGNERRFFPAVIERKMAGHEWEPHGHGGWAWSELDVPPAADGASVAERDAFKLLAVFMQHTDSKAEQQRVLCLEPHHGKQSESCEQPFLMISDLGLTFGRANLLNRNSVGSVNLDGWRRTPVWKSADGCVGNIRKSFSGTLDEPVISEAGRRFLAQLLTQLSDSQLADLFESARVDLRLTTPGNASTNRATVDEWVRVFKEKRDEIVTRRCA